MECYHNPGFHSPVRATTSFSQIQPQKNNPYAANLPINPQTGGNVSPWANPTQLTPISPVVSASNPFMMESTVGPPIQQLPVTNPGWSLGPPASNMPPYQQTYVPVPQQAQQTQNPPPGDNPFMTESVVGHKQTPVSSVNRPHQAYDHGPQSLTTVGETTFEMDADASDLLNLVQGEKKYARVSSDVSTSQNSQFSLSVEDKMVRVPFWENESQHLQLSESFLQQVEQMMENAARKTST